MRPIDPDEFSQGEVSLQASVFFLSISKSRASTEAVIGVCTWIAVKFSKKEAFLIHAKRMGEVNPDLEVMRGGFHDHASGFKGAIGLFVMEAKQGVREVIGEQIVLRVLGLHEDMPPLGVLSL